MRSAPVIDVDRFAPAERCALRLDGDCFDLGLGAVAMGVLVDPAVRAATLAAAVSRYGLVVDTWGAAWVHGAWPSLPDPLTLAVDVRGARRTRAIVPAPREAVYAPGEVEVLGGVRVTAPLKTAFDLLRLYDRHDLRVEPVARELLARCGHGRESAVAAVEAAPRCNGKRDVIARIRALCPA